MEQNDAGATQTQDESEPPSRRIGPQSLGQLALPALAAVTLGLAPFSPEPHVVGKIRWVAGGAVGMTAMDWGDLALHGAPWLWLAWAVLALLWTRAR